MPEGKRYTAEDVLRGLRLCGRGYYAGACQECPFIKDCMPGENDALMEAAERAIIELQKEAGESRARVSRELEGHRVYIVIRRRHGKTVECQIRQGRFRPGDYAKLGKTVFLRKHDAQKKLGRMQHGCE